MVAHPEDQRFRTIRLLNAHFQATVARHRGGLEVLRALGFVERRSVEDDELCLVLEVVGDVGRCGEIWGDMGRYGEIVSRTTSSASCSRHP